MLISRVSEGEGRGGEGRDAVEYQTADELFELMAKDHNYNSNDQPLSTRDLIILYKNIDVGSKLMSSANVGQRKAPNQHVETVVYKDERESDDSDVSEIYSNEDLQNVFSINNERIDLINNLSSIQHPLCHKLGDIEIQSPNFASEYDRHFLFKDPYIKQQLKNINILPDSTEFDTILPASLLDYICCKRLEDNYNFYMDNIIRYVQHTIEQLKRISNGDYLTDRAREKWREGAKDLVVPNCDASKVLATSVSIPIHVMGKVDVHRSTWDDIVHSEVDVRSLSKILEKKIIIEVPKLICGSYRLFSDRCSNNLIISCKKNLKRADDKDKKESRVDVVFQLKPLGSGHVISNINSIKILQKIPSITRPEPNEVEHEVEEHPKIIEISEDRNELNQVAIVPDKSIRSSDSAIQKSVSDVSDCSLPNNHYFSSTQPYTVDKGVLSKKGSLKTIKAETDATVISPDELRCAIRRLNMQTPVPEESEESSVCKKRSPTRVRIKSPYENQSYAIEEKKRKKLLEIREKREKKKMALSENCKVTKHKYGKNVVMAQPSSSVTKLSITNKSFYNSIYGENVNYECGTSKKARKLQKKDILEERSDQGPKKELCESSCLQSSITALHSSTFDDGNTETIIQMQQKLDLETYPTPMSAMSNYNTDISLLSRLIGSSGTDCSSDDDSSPAQEVKRNEGNIQEVLGEDKTFRSPCMLVPANTPKDKEQFVEKQDEIKKTATPVECRKSIDKIYGLLKKLGKNEDNEMTSSATQYVSNNNHGLNIDGRRSSTIQVSDSGTSVKHHTVSSNPSTFSFEKNNNVTRHMYQDQKKKETPVTVVPKVIISTKLQTSKLDVEWNKANRKRNITSSSSKVPDNPLKAISQLLHEFDNVQKTRNKSHRRDDHVLADGKSVSRQGSSKKQRQEPTTKDGSLAPLKSSARKDRRSRASYIPDVGQYSHQAPYVDDRHTSKIIKRNLSDIMDEAREARGEAVRGPSKPYSRLNTLAQPKKSYVQAHNDEYQNKYGRNITTNRLQRVTTPAPVVEKNTISLNIARNRRKGPDTTSMTSPKPGIPSVPPLERTMRPRRSASNSPVRKRPPATTDLSLRQNTAPKSPELKKKMVAVESYVKSHYGHVPLDTTELNGHEVHKSRVPLIPNDIELASLSSPIAEESTALGNQLHYMVDTMLNTTAPALSILTEGQETASRLSDGLGKLSTSSLLKIDERKSESDYPVDIFEDKSILTAVESITKDKIQDKVIDENIETIDTYDVQPFNSATELRKLETALYQQMSVGAFSKRLRIKNLTLTPKQSLQQVIVVQSGDAGSLLVKSSLSQSFRSDSKTDSLTALKPLAALSNTHINWGFTNIPLQVATVGYAFPKFQSPHRNSIVPCIQNLSERTSNEDVTKDACKSHKTSQCFKGIYTETCTERATQANFASSTSSSCSLIDNSIEQKVETVNNYKKIQPVTKICEKIRSMTEKFEKEQSINRVCQRLQPIKEKCERKQTITEGCEKVQVTERCERGQQRTEQFETAQHVTEKCERAQQSIEQREKIQPIIVQWDKNNDIMMSTNSLNNGEAKSEGENVRKPEIIDHSTSLDILMGLLNEIRNITGEPIDKNVDNRLEHNRQSKELEIILNNAATHESSIESNCRDLVSVSSLDKLHRVDSNPSIYSFNLLKEGDRGVDYENNGKIENVNETSTGSHMPKNADKEVTVNVEKQFVNKLTDAPSCFFPLRINNGTNISDSFIEISSEPSTRSEYSTAKFDFGNCAASFDDSCDRLKIEEANEQSATDNSLETEYFKALEEHDHREQLVNEKVSTIAVVGSSYKCTSPIITTAACAVIGSNFDPLLKVKRDILVTVYSILVFTVFAALSFPKVFFQQEM